MKSDSGAVFLSTLPAGRRERRLAFAVLLVSSVIFVALAPFAKRPLGQVWAFIPIYESALVINDLVTAALLFGQFSILRSRALQVLASAYLFTALMTIAHALTFPGLFAPTGLLGAGPQSTAWLYMFWHAGFPLLVIAYARLEASPSEARGETNRPLGAIVASAAAALVAASVFTFVATAGQDWLPGIMRGNHYSPSLYGVVAAVWGLSFVALGVLWRRRPHSLLDLWLMVVMCAWLFDIGLAVVLNAGRFDLGFYAGRIYGLLAASFVLGVLLLENGVLYARLVETHERERHERRRAQRAEEAATSANHAKSEFLSRMSHELRTPLNGILGFAQLLERELEQPEQREGVAHILKGGRHLLGLINEILDIARIEAGKFSVSLEPVEASEVIASALDLVRPQAAARDIGLSTAVIWRGHVMADRQRLQQVLLNLLSNAVKYNRPEGAVTVSCDRTPSGMCRLAVTDTGLGIAPERMPRLFTPFDRLDVQDGSIEGTGLGLALSKGLVEIMGGTLSAASTPGTGSTFSLELPIAAAPSHEMPADETRAPGAEAPGVSGTVLYIEDNSSNLRLVERIVARRPGVKLLSAMQGRPGLELARAHRPDAIVLDLHLPDISGQDVLARLQADPATREIPVVILSADATPSRTSSLLKAGAHAYLTKPLSVAQFLGVLDELLVKVAR
ncbi:MAG TPA: MASE4 domain-containing protein [Methylomirabilota bacterium]|nr:MASE4 domain-containing protein [Methylomirabilota bacterium]